MLLRVVALKLVLKPPPVVVAKFCHTGNEAPEPNTNTLIPLSTQFLLIVRTTI